MEKILKVLTVENKDIRKADWNNKEVSHVLPGWAFQSFSSSLIIPYDEKEYVYSINPAR